MKIFEHLHIGVSRVKPKLFVSVVLLSMFSAMVLTSQLASAAVYKKVDADGNVSFSDIPDKTAKLIIVAPLATVPAMSPELIESTLANDQSSINEERPVKYSLTILSPQSDQTYRRGSDSFSANVQVKPELRKGDRLITLVDGKSGSGGSTEDMDRGQHTFEAQVVNARGQVLASQSVSFFVQQSSVKQQARMGIKH